MFKRIWLIVVIVITDRTEGSVPPCFSVLCKRAYDTGYFLLNATRSLLKQEHAIILTTDGLNEIGCITSVLHENNVKTLLIKLQHLNEKINEQLSNLGDQRFIITLLASSEHQALEIFGKISEIIKSSFTWWTIIMEDFNEEDFAQSTIPMSYPNIVFIKIFTSESLQTKYRMFGIFALDKDQSSTEGKLVSAKGIWYAKNFSFSFYKPFSPESGLKLDLMGKTLTVSALEDYPFLNLTTLENGKVIATSGIDYNILLILSKHFNFTFEIVSPEDKEWGSKRKDGTWTGLIGMVSMKRADFAIGEITISMQREEAVDFTEAYYSEPAIFVCPASRYKSRAFAIAYPFRIMGRQLCHLLITIMWGSLIIVLAICAALLYVTSTIEGVLSCEHIMTLRNCAWYLFGTYASQGGHSVLPRGSGARTIIGFWLLYSIVVVAAYSGNLKSFLMMPGSKDSIDEIKDLIYSVQEKGFSVGAIGASFVTLTLEETKDARLQVIFEEMNKDARNLVSGTPSGLEKIIKEKYCFISSSLSILAKAAKLGGEKFHFGQESLFSTSFAVALQPKSLLKRPFDKVISRIVETGLVEKWINDILEEMDATMHQSEKNEPPFRPMNLEDFLGSIYLLFIGYSVSLLMFAIEIIRKRTGRNIPL